MAVEKPITNLSLAISEKDFSGQVEDLLKLFGWHWTHFRPAFSSKGYRTPIKGHKGFPDYCAVRNSTCLFIELKSEKGKLIQEQVEWIDLLQQVAKVSLGVMVFVWRPSQIDDIVGILK